VYINGATAEPSEKIISAPKSKRKMIIGANHHFLRTFRKSKNSLIIESLLMGNSPFLEKILKNSLKYLNSAFLEPHCLLWKPRALHGVAKGNISTFVLSLFNDLWSQKQSHPFHGW